MQNSTRPHRRAGAITAALVTTLVVILFFGSLLWIMAEEEPIPAVTGMMVVYALLAVAIVAGVLGMAPDDARIRESLALAQMTGLAVSIAPGEIDGAHPNTARIALWGEEGGHICMQGASVGGGNILVTQVNGLPVELDGAHAALVVVHLDAPGTIAAVTEEMSRAGANICNFRLARAAKGGTAVMTIEVDGALEAAVAERVQALANVQAVTLLAPV